MKIEIQDRFNNIDIYIDTEKISYAVCEASNQAPLRVEYEVIQPNREYFNQLYGKFYVWKCYTISGQEVAIVIYDDDSQAKMEQAIKFGQYFNEPVFAIIYKTQ